MKQFVVFVISYVQCDDIILSLKRFGVQYVKALVTVFGRGTEPGLVQQHKQQHPSADHLPLLDSEQPMAIPNVSVLHWFSAY